MDAEVGALVCPRPLYVEVGVKDTLLDVRHARPEARRLKTFYQSLGIPEAFHYEEHAGGHELDKSDRGIDFLCRHLGVDNSANKYVRRTANRRRSPNR